jgi:phosphinothricin acetyltransferase
VIRLATRSDAPAAAALYAPYVTGAVISFEAVPPSSEEMAERIAATLVYAPYLVYEKDGEVLGFAYAARHRERAAYRWSVDVSVYVHPRAHRQGVGRALYTSLFALLRLQGFYAAHAGITLPNPSSVGLHEAVGFVPVGVYRSVGFKMGGWQDVGWWQLPLRDRTGEPAPPLSLAEAQARPEWPAAMGAGLGLLRQ